MPQIDISLVSGKTDAIDITTNDLYLSGFAKTKTFGIKRDAIATINIVKGVDGIEHVEMGLRNLSTIYTYTTEIVPLNNDTYKGHFPVSTVSGVAVIDINDLCTKLRNLIFT